jgi:transcriptional regulator with XRE-family HTH domain
MIIYNESLNTCSAEYVKCFAVTNQQTESLADYVRRIRVQVKDFSLSEVEMNSGGEIDSSYVSRIENGQVKNVTPEKLNALAKGLQVPPDEIFAVARGKSLTEAEAFDSEVYVLFTGFEELSDKDKAEMLASVRMLGNEIQRRRPKRPPDDKGKGKNKGKK